MPELTEYEIREIEKSISNFIGKQKSLFDKIDKARYDDKFYKAQSKFNTYCKEEETAIKEAEKAFNKAMNGSGFFSRKGLNEILNKKVNESTDKIKTLLDDYYDFINGIYDSFNNSSLDSVVTNNFSSDDYRENSISLNDDFETNISNVVNQKAFAIPIIIEDSQETKTVVEENELKEEKIIKSEEDSKKQDVDVENLVLESNVTELGIGAIDNNNLKTIVCTNVKQIKANAFRNCNNLSKIVISKSIEYINVNAFRNIPLSCVIAFEDSKERIMSLDNGSFIKDRNVIFDYKDGNDIQEPEVFSEVVEQPKAKRVVIKQNTHLNSPELKKVFCERNARYYITVEELEQGIINAGTDVDKDLILLETLLVHCKNVLPKLKFFDYGISMGKVITLAKYLGKNELSLNAIFAMLFLCSSGYRMVVGKQDINCYIQDPEKLVYSAQMEMKTLRELDEIMKFDKKHLVDLYINSSLVKELNSFIPKSYYSIEDSAKLMINALKSNPLNDYYPSKSGIIRNY